MFSPKSSQHMSSNRGRKAKLYEVLDDMTVVKYTSEQ